MYPTLSKAVALVPSARVEQHKVSHSAQLAQLPAPEPALHYSKGLAVLLAVLFGYLGAHLFYLGDRKPALAYLLTTLACIGLMLIAVPVANSAALGVGMGGAVVGIFLLLLGAGGIAYVYLRALFDGVRILAGGLEPPNGKF
ncbi:NINE protein [Hymenobacter sp. BT770]|nr:TM2 domain-containing protein [Hymenobacter sp. BT770]MCC3152834.1 TM2 domain-containing protein [Hymenobacter sp. BT770]